MLPDKDTTAFQPAVIDEADRGSYVARAEDSSTGAARVCPSAQ
jgi:hypothetical protein